MYLQLLTIYFLITKLCSSARVKRSDKCQDRVYIKDCGSYEMSFSRTKINEIVVQFTSICSYNNLKYKWHFQTNDEDAKTIIEHVSESNVYVLEPFTLKREIYTLEVTAQFTRNGVSNSELAACGLDVFAPDPIPYISGGSERIVEANHDIYIDGSLSVDRNVPFNEPGKLIYNWQCLSGKPGSVDFCLDQTHNNVIKIPAKYATPNKYIFTLRVKSQVPDSWVNTSQTIKIVPEATELAIICEKNCPPIISKTNEKHLTYLRVTCVRKCDGLDVNLYQWTVDDNDFDYNSWTQFGRNSDKFILKENVLKSGRKYTVRVKYSDRIGEAVKILDVDSPIKINSCEVIPSKGQALTTKFTMNCDYTGEGYRFEIFTLSNVKKVYLTKRNNIESVEFILSSQTQVFLQIFDVEGFDDLYKLNVEVERNKHIKNMTESIPELIKAGDLITAIQITDGIIEEIGNKDPEIRKSLLENFRNVEIRSKDEAIHVASLVTKLVNNLEAKSDPFQGEVATGICKKSGEAELEYLKKEAYVTSLSTEIKDNAKTLMMCAETDTKENFEILEPVFPDLEITTPYPILSLPEIVENYPDYDIDNSIDAKITLYEKTAKNLIQICETNFQMLFMTVVKGEDTLSVKSNSSSAHVTRMTGVKLAGTEIGSEKVQIMISRDLENIQDEVDVKICSWDNDPFWWNVNRTVIATMVVLIKLTQNGTELTNFTRSNKIHLDFNEPKAEVHDIEVQNESLLRVEVRKGEAFIVKFHLKELESYRSVITHFEKPDPKKLLTKIITGKDNTLFQEHNLDYDSWYYVYVFPEEESDNFTYSVTVFTKSCYAWNGNSKSWEFACQGSSHTHNDKIHCVCHHLSILGGVFYNNPYKVDKIFAHADFKMQLSSCFIVFIAFISILAFYFLFLTIMVTKKTTKGLRIYLPSDISTTSRYVYLVEITTGRKISSGTSSNICIKISADLNKSKSHVLNYPDPQQRIFERGNKDWFLIPTLQRLGNLEEIALWSDYSGRYPKWFCSNVTVYDIQTNEKWHFKVDKWFDLPPNGQIYYTSRVEEKRKKWRFGKVLFRGFPKR